MRTSAALTRHGRADPKILDFVAWAVMSGVRMFQRVHVTTNGLVAVDRIPQYEFAAVVPAKATISVLNVVDDSSFPARCGPGTLSDPVPWWPDLSWGSLCTVSYIACAVLANHPKHINTYLSILPFDDGMPIGRIADASQKSKDYVEFVKPLISHCGAVSREDEFHSAFRHTYCLWRRHALPLWTGNGASGVGHPYFAASPFLAKTQGSCDVMGMVPIVDLANHCHDPNSVIGFPDKDMLSWLAREKGVPVQSDAPHFVLQALRDIEPGQQITVDKNAFFQFDPETFQAWFGYPYRTTAADETPTVPVR